MKKDTYTVIMQVEAESIGDAIFSAIYPEEDDSQSRMSKVHYISATKDEDE